MEKKCINCKYFINCKNANEDQACEKFGFIRREVIRYENKRDNKKDKK